MLGRRALLLAMLTAAAGPARGACRADAVASVPLGKGAGGVWTVPLMVDGKPADFVLDIGAERSVVSDAAIRRLGLKRDEWVSTVLRGVGGVEWRANATASSLVLGGVALRRQMGPPTHSLGVATLPVDGLLGADYLAAFDLEIDPARGVLTLHAVQDCGEPAWRTPHEAVRAERPRRGLLLVPVAVDGVVLTAQFDTGSSVTFLSRRGLARLGAADGGSPSGHAVGVGPQPLALSRHRAAELRLGPLVLHDVTLAAGAPAGGYVFDMVLGLDVLRQRAFWISYATNRLLVALR